MGDETAKALKFSHVVLHIVSGALSMLKGVERYRITCSFERLLVVVTDGLCGSHPQS